MSWASLFAQGECIVQVSTKNATTPTWSGTLGLGQSSPEFVDVGGTAWMVSVDAVGNVTVEIDSAVVSSGFGAMVAILPQYDVSTSQTQVSAINSKYAGSYGGGTASCDGAEVTALTFDAVTGDATPASVAFPAHAPSPESFVQVTASGAF